MVQIVLKINECSFVFSGSGGKTPQNKPCNICPEVKDIVLILLNKQNQNKVKSGMHFN